MIGLTKDDPDPFRRNVLPALVPPPLQPASAASMTIPTAATREVPLIKILRLDSRISLPSADSRCLEYSSVSWSSMKLPRRNARDRQNNARVPDSYPAGDSPIRKTA